MSPDDAFGPQLGGAFDFTLTFDHAILSILPSSLLILVTPFFIRYFKSQPEVILPGPLLWGKIAVVGTLFGINIGSFVVLIVSLSLHSAIAAASAALSCVGTLCLAACLHVEHRHSMRSSGFLSVWVTLSVVLDGTIARSYYLRSAAYHNVGALVATTGAMKLIVMILEEIPKKNYAKDKDTGKPIGKEAMSGFWNRIFYLWLNQTLYSGFRVILTVDNLDNLENIFSSEALAERFITAWHNVDNTAKHSLAKACLRATMGHVLAVVFPRICLSFFMFVQPFFLEAAVSAVELKANSNTKYGLLGAAALIYLGVAVSRSLSSHMNCRFVTLVRGMLVGAIFAKLLRLPYSSAERSAAATLMSTDIEGITRGLPMLHELWVRALELVVGIYLLSRLIKQACLLVFIPTAISCAVSWYLGERLPEAQEEWNEQTQTRVAKTSSTLSQIKAIKMIGLEGSISRQIRDIRTTEIQRSIKARLLSIVYNTTAVFVNVFTPPIVLAGALFWTTFSGRLTAIGAYTTLAIINLVIEPLQDVISATAKMSSTVACFNRIQNFLVLPEGIEVKLAQAEVKEAIASENIFPAGLQIKDIPQLPIVSQKQPQQSIARFQDVSIAGQGSSNTVILQHIELNVVASEFIIVTGRTGCGKSTFLRAFLREVQLISGSLSLVTGPIAYCDQTVWLRNASIRDNIVWYNTFDEAWYNSVLDTCMLRKDLEQFENGDLKPVGSNGMGLSGGQKHRVALARALYARLSLIVLDDIFSALDPTTAAEIFSGLFGPEGLIKTLGSTVILATQSVQFFSAADRIVLITSDGTVEVQTESHDTAFQRQVEEILADDEELAKKLQDARRGQESPSAPLRLVSEGEPPAEVISEAIRQQGDLSLYWFFIKTIGVVKSAIWFVLTIMLSTTEKFPDVFIRIWLDQAPDNKVYFVGYVLISLLACVLCLLMLSFWYAEAVPRSLESLHNTLLETVMRSKLSVLTKTDHGVFLNFFSQDMDLTSQTLPLVFMKVFYFFFYMLVSLLIILSGIKYAGAITPFVFTVVYVVQHFYLRSSRQIRLLDIECKAPLYTQFTESAAGLLHIRAFGWEQEVLAQSLELLDISQKPYYYMFVIQRWLEMVMDLLVLALAMFMLPIAFNIELSTTAAGIALSLVTLIQFSEILTLFVRDWTELETSLGAITRLRHLFANTPQEPDINGGVGPYWPQHGHVVMDNVVAKYSATDPGAPILDGISLTIASGQKVGIVGRTGSGKSSLLLACLNFLDYTGIITIDGIDISTVPLQILRSRIPTISQDTIDLDGTIRFNLFPFIDDVTDKQADELETKMITLLWQLSLWTSIEQAGGLDIKLSDFKPSEGQKQIIGIIRGVLRQQFTESNLILMDEPTSYLDADTVKEVQDIFNTMLRSCTIITVAHQSQSIKNSNTIFEMADGKIVARIDQTPTPKRAEPVGANPTWNPNEHRYIGHAGTDISSNSEDAMDMINCGLKKTMPLKLRAEIQRMNRTRRRIIRREAAATGKPPMSRDEFIERYVIPLFHRLDDQSGDQAKSSKS